MIVLEVPQTMRLRLFILLPGLIMGACSHTPLVQVVPADRSPATANSGTIAGKATRVPWSGYWWPMSRAELALGWNDGKGRRSWSKREVLKFEECLSSDAPACKSLISDLEKNKAVSLSPLMKFDLYVRRFLKDQFPNGVPFSNYAHAAKRELEIHYIESPADPRASETYSGKCIGWALSTFDYEEPTKTVELSGILFTPADIKGLLATIYNGAQFFIPDDKWMGTPFHHRSDHSPEARLDVNPADFVRALFATIGRGGMLEGDLDPDDGVWNYPIHQYELKWTKTSATKAEVLVKIYYANDEVEVDGVFSTNSMRPDLLSRELTFVLDLPPNWTGDLSLATGGSWTGESVDTHPDALILDIESGWKKSIYDYKGTGFKTEVNFQAFKRVNMGHGKWVPINEEILERYYGTGAGL